MPTDQRSRDWEHALRAALDSHEAQDLTRLMEEAHIADLAMLVPDIDDPELHTVLDNLDDEQVAALLGELSDDPETQIRVLTLLPIERIRTAVGEMYSDDAADMLRELDAERAAVLLGQLEPEVADDVAELMAYPEDTAGGLMAKEFVKVQPEDTVAEVLTLLRRHHDDAELIYYLYVLDEEERLLGVTTLRYLIVRAPETTMAAVMTREFVSVQTDTPQDEVAELVRRHDLMAVPVLDDEGRMQGIVTVDDVGDVVQEGASDDLLEISGNEDEEEERRWVTYRGWRSGLLALAGGLCIALVIAQFSRELAAWMPVAALLPFLLVLGITAGSQTALAIDQAYGRQAERHQLGRIFLRELLAGAALALVGALLAGILVYGLHRRPGFALTVGLALAVGLWTASGFGALGAMLLRHAGERLGPRSHALIVALALFIAVSAYLLMARWTAGFAPHPPL